MGKYWKQLQDPKIQQRIMNMAWGAKEAYKQYKTISAPVQGPLNTRDASRTALTSQHDVIRAYYKPKKRRRLTRKARKRRARKRKFKKRVVKAIAPKTVTYHYNERANGWLNMGVMPTIWGTNPCQQVLGSILSGSPSQNRTSLMRLFEGLPLTTGDYNDSTATGVGRYFANALGTIAERYSGSDQVANTDWLTTFRAYIKHCAIQFTVYNNFTVPINVDVYEFTAARDIPRNDFYNTPLTAMSRITNVDAIYFSTGMSNTVNITDFGATPWDFPGLSKHWKVTNKTTIYLPGNGQTAVQFKGNKGVWSGARGNEMCAFKGKTTEYVFVVGSKIGVGMDTTTTPIKVISEKTYKIKPIIGTQWAKPNFLSAQCFAYLIL